MDYAAVARLRPMMPLEALAKLMGKKWRPPSARYGGLINGTADYGFAARMEIGGRIGELRFYDTDRFHKGFPHHLLIEQLHVGMSVAEALVVRPSLELFPNPPQLPSEWSLYRDRTGDGHDLTVRFLDGVVQSIGLVQPGAVFPEPPKLLADPNLTKAYDFIRDPQRVQPVAGRGAEWAGGWSFGLPPGIAQSQWPLSPSLGHPLRHAFTLHVPAEYRRQGADLMALSLFVDDQLEELPSSSAVEAYFAMQLSAEPPADPRLLPFWAYRRARHSRQFDMTDDLGTHYAAIWLTQAEFDGPLCTPPDLSGNRLLSRSPGWLNERNVGQLGSVDFKVRNHDQKSCVALLPGEAGVARLDAAFPIRALTREGDPNVGRPAREMEHECKESGYIRPFAAEGKALNLERFFGRNHLGGTMFPNQGPPEFGPCYFEFEEDFGGFNFGGGNSQIDLEKMALDWACA